MEVQNKPLPVKIWTSSHGLASHYFPQSLEKVFKENNEIELPSINAKGGRTFSDDLVATYTSEFDKIKDSKDSQMSVFLLGDNDTRRYGKRGSFKVFKNTKAIINLHKQTAHPLLICGQMPSPRTYPSTNPLAEYLDDIIQDEIESLYVEPEGRFFGYVCAKMFFNDQHGFLRNKEYFMNDGVHLTRLGAERLATCIIENAKTLAKAVRNSD